MLTQLGIFSFALILGSMANAASSAPAPTTNDGITPPVVITKTKKPQLHLIHTIKTYPVRILPIEVIYASQPLSTDTSKALNKIDQSLNNVDWNKSFKAIAILDDSYQTKLFSYDISPYVSLGFYEKIKAEKSCDVDSAGPCLVLENDSVTGTKTSVVYAVGTRPEKKDPTNVRVYRIPIDQKKYKNEIKLITHDKAADGIYSFSRAQSAQEAQSLNASLVEDSSAVSDSTSDTAVKPLPSQFFLNSRSVHFVGVSEDKKEAYGLAVQKLIDDNTRPYDGSKSIFSACAVHAEMVPTRRFVGVDFHSIPNLWRKVKSYSRVSQNAHLDCLFHGQTLQQIPVVVREHGIFIFGIVASKSKQQTFSIGLASFANSAVDVLTMHDFIFPLRASAGFGPVQAGVTPMILSSQEGRDAITATAPETTLFSGFAANADLTIFGGLTIEADIPTAEFN